MRYWHETSPKSAYIYCRRLIYAELYFYISGKYKEVKTDFKGHPITTLLKELMETLEKTPADPMEQEESWLQPFEYGSN
jgi:hypothetical protein